MIAVLVDTDVLVWHLRGYAQATRRLDRLGALIAPPPRSSIGCRC